MNVKKCTNLVPNVFVTRSGKKGNEKKKCKFRIID